MINVSMHETRNVWWGIHTAKLEAVPEPFRIMSRPVEGFLASIMKMENSVERRRAVMIYLARLITGRRASARVSRNSSVGIKWLAWLVEPGEET